MTINKAHGSPYDRGAADKWYGGYGSPHCYEGATAASRRIEESEMTPQQLKEYWMGFNGSSSGKDWGSPEPVEA